MQLLPLEIQFEFNNHGKMAGFGLFTALIIETYKYKLKSPNRVTVSKFTPLFLAFVCNL